MSTWNELQRVFGERLALPGSDAFTTHTTLVFDGAPATPAAAVAPRDEAEVALAVRAAAEAGMHVGTRSGGHGPARRGIVDGGLLIDMRGMNEVHIDPDALVGRAGGGVTAAEYSAAAGEHGLATGFGDTGEVGVAGLTQGGGLGYLSRSDGLTIDNLLSARVVLADGSIVTTDADSYPELFWALRGGGGGFGIVTSLEFRLRPLREVTGGMMILPPDPGILTGAIAIASEAPRELTVNVSAMVAPPAPFLPAELHGTPVIALRVAHLDDEAAADRAIGEIRSLGDALFDTIARIPYPDVLVGPPAGPPITISTASGFRERVDDAWASRLLDAVVRESDAGTGVRAMAEVRPMGGAIGETARKDTAFPYRDKRMAVSFNILEATGAGERVGRLAEDLRLGEHGYVGFLSADSPGTPFPDATRDRLREIKRHLDPGGLFRTPADES